MTPDRQAFITGLRACADFLERYPSVPVPYSTEMNVFTSDRAALAAVARTASWEKHQDGNYFWLAKNFGSVSLHINVEREKVCRRVVIGTEVIPAQPERVVEAVEWICDDPLLIPASDRISETVDAI